MHLDASPDLASRIRLLLPAVALWHLLAWMLAPALVYASLPLDTLELLGWGQEWQWGYYKHPPLAPWLGEAWLQLFAGHLDSLYLLAQLCVLLTLFYVWRIARLWLDPVRAVLATVLLEGSYFHTLLSTNFNINLLQLPLWAGLCFHFLRALQGGARWHWFACALFAALCVLTKYSGALLCLSCVAILFGTRPGRAALRTPWPWLGAALALLLLTPHLVWLHQQDYLPLRYLRGFERQATDSLAMHIFEPLRFAAGALLGMLFSLLLFLTVRDRAGERPPQPWTPILLLLCFGPLLLAVLYGVWSGSRLKSTWGFPFFNLIGIFLFVRLRTRIEHRTLRRFTLALAAVALLFGASHLTYKLASARSKTAFDGQALAQAATHAWDARFDTPLRIVAGNHVLSAIVSSYGASRPSMLVDGEFRLSPWVTPAAVRGSGALVICEAGEAAMPCAAAAALVPPAASPPDRVTLAGRHFLLHFLPPEMPASLLHPAPRPQAVP